MSSTASNYDLDRLYAGLVLAAFSFSGAMLTLSSKKSRPSANEAVTAVVTVSYGVMMFASSFVEEEQQYWYWITSAVLLFFAVTRYALLEAVMMVLLII